MFIIWKMMHAKVLLWIPASITKQAAAKSITKLAWKSILNTCRKKTVYPLSILYINRQHLCKTSYCTLSCYSKLSPFVVAATQYCCIHRQAFHGHDFVTYSISGLLRCWNAINSLLTVTRYSSQNPCSLFGLCAQTVVYAGGWLGHGPPHRCRPPSQMPIFFFSS